MTDPVPSKEESLVRSWTVPFNDVPGNVVGPQQVVLLEDDERLRSALRGIQSCSTCEACRGAATRALGDVTPEPKPEHGGRIMTLAECVEAEGGIPFVGMEASTAPITHQEIFSAVHHHASEIVRLTAAVPAQCSPQPPGAGQS